MYSTCSNCILCANCKNKRETKNGRIGRGAKDINKCMHDRDEAYSRLSDSDREILIDEGYQELAYAIIERALIDVVSPDLAMNKNEHIVDNPLKFLKSKWACILSGVSNDKLMEVLAKYESKIKGVNR